MTKIINFEEIDKVAKNILNKDEKYTPPYPQEEKKKEKGKQ